MRAEVMASARTSQIVHKAKSVHLDPNLRVQWLLLIQDESGQTPGHRRGITDERKWWEACELDHGQDHNSRSRKRSKENGDQKFPMSMPILMMLKKVQINNKTCLVVHGGQMYEYGYMDYSYAMETGNLATLVGGYGKRDT